MHELSIAQNILEIVEGAVPVEQAAGVRTERVRVGRLSGVVADSLQFCFGAVVAGTRWSGADLAIESVPAVSECKDCSHRFAIDDAAFLCPSCGGSSIALVSGTELQVVEVELADDPLEAT